MGLGLGMGQQSGGTRLIRDEVRKSLGVLRLSGREEEDRAVQELSRKRGPQGRC